MKYIFFILIAIAFGVIFTKAMDKLSSKPIQYILPDSPAMCMEVSNKFNF